MDYKKTYEQLVQHRLANPLPKDEYGEDHHIIPLSEGGEDEPCNIVRLSAREHYIAHLLLAKIYNDKAMLLAVMMMQCKSNSHQRSFKFNSHLYEKLRLKFSESISGENHWNYGKPAWNSGKTGIYSDETLNKMSERTKAAMQRPEVKKKMHDSLVGHCYWTDDTKMHMSQKFSGEGNPFYGKTHTEEVRKKISNAISGENHPNYGKHLSEETRDKISKSKIGKHYYNNGVIQVKRYECPPGFVRGGLKKKS